MDGDPDLEPIDEREPGLYGEMVLGYADDGHGGEDQRCPLSWSETKAL